MECNVCMNIFGEGNHAPRMLPCGHTFCSPCIQKLISHDPACPKCRRNLQVTNIDELAINFTVLELLESQKENKTNEVKVEENTCMKHNISKEYRCEKCKVWLCGACAMKDHREPPRGECKILEAQDAIKEITDSTKATVAKTDSLFNQQIELLNKTLEEKNEEIEKLLSERNEISKEILYTENKQKELQKLNDDFLESLTMSRIDEAAMIIEKLVKETYFWPLNEKVGHYAELKVDEKTMWGKISFEDENIILHSMESGPCPPHGIRIPFDNISEAVDSESPMAFLDLSWNRQIQGRIIVKMFGDTPRATNFLRLCSGEKGPSYKKTKFFDVDNKGKPGECIEGGDYENNDGSGGLALVTGIENFGIYDREIKSGCVVGFHCVNHIKSLSNFSICVRDDSNATFYGCFGEVVSGLETAKAAADHQPITDVIVEDCGLIANIK